MPTAIFDKHVVKSMRLEGQVELETAESNTGVSPVLQTDCPPQYDSPPQNAAYSRDNGPPQDEDQMVTMDLRVPQNGLAVLIKNGEDYLNYLQRRFAVMISFPQNDIESNLRVVGTREKLDNFYPVL